MLSLLPRARKSLLVVVYLAAMPGVHAADSSCASHPAAQGALTRLTASMAAGRFITYEPTSLRVLNGVSTQASEPGIRADLEVLRPRFDSLITYTSINGAQRIPAVAASLGFKSVIVGVWDPFDPLQIDAALATVRDNPIVVGLSLGNELLFSKHHTFEELTALVAQVRLRVPATPLSVTEPFHMFYEPAATPLLARLDFLLLNVHPVFQNWFPTASDHKNAQFVLNVVTQIGEKFCGPILVKEVGEPTAPARDGFTPERQASFFASLKAALPPSRRRAFAYFASFDAPWREYDEIATAGASAPATVHAAEAHWGLYDESRQPKPVVADIPLLDSTTRR